MEILSMNLYATTSSFIEIDCFILKLVLILVNSPICKCLDVYLAGCLTEMANSKVCGI